MAILDWSIGPTYIMALLGCQHEQKVCPLLDYLLERSDILYDTSHLFNN